MRERRGQSCHVNLSSFVAPRFSTCTVQLAPACDDTWDPGRRHPCANRTLIAFTSSPLAAWRGSCHDIARKMKTLPRARKSSSLGRFYRCS